MTDICFTSTCTCDGRSAVNPYCQDHGDPGNLPPASTAPNLFEVRLGIDGRHYMWECTCGLSGAWHRNHQQALSEARFHSCILGARDWYAMWIEDGPRVIWRRRTRYDLNPFYQ